MNPFKFQTSNCVMEDVFNYCWITLLAEAKKCNVFFDQNTCNVTNSTDESFDKPLNRVSYLYKFGTFNILLLERCVTQFTYKVPKALQILDKVCSKTNLNVCSLSTCPGIDVVGFLYSLNQLGKPLNKPIDIKLINKYGSWRNLVQEMISSEIAGFPPSSTCKLIQCDVLNGLSTKAQSYLKNADVVLMFQPFTSVKATKSVISVVMKKILLLLKPGAFVFFISDKEKSAYFSELNTCGTVWYGPTEVRLENMPHNGKVTDLVGTKPVCSGSSYFAVWQKTESVEETHSATLQNTEKPIVVENIPCKPCVDPVLIQKPVPTSGTSSLSNNNHKSNIYASQTSSTGNNNSEFCSKVKNKISPIKKQPAASPDVKCEEDKTKLSLNSLLKSFENLVITLEDFVKAQKPFKDSQKNDVVSVDNHFHGNQNRCCGKMYRSHYESTHSCNTHSHFTCDRSCQSQCQPSSRTQFFCDYNSIRSQCCSGRCQSNLVHEKPCIVIPLQHLNGDDLVRILSVVNK